MLLDCFKDFVAFFFDFVYIVKPILSDKWDNLIFCNGRYPLISYLFRFHTKVTVPNLEAVSEGWVLFNYLIESLYRNHKFVVLVIRNGCSHLLEPFAVKRRTHHKERKSSSQSIIYDGQTSVRCVHHTDYVYIVRDEERLLAI